jgi:hypothetical protein
MSTATNVCHSDTLWQPEYQRFGRLCVPKTSSLLASDRIVYYRSEMIALMCFCLRLFALPLKSKIRLEAQNVILRHQLIVLERKIRGRVRLTNSNPLFSFGSIVGFPQCWMRFGSSDPTGGWSQINADLRALIRQMSADNPLWRVPRIHGELLQLGFEVAQSSVAKYMIKRPASPSQAWLAFLRNHSTQNP